MKKTVAILFAILLPFPALADYAESKACASGLSPSAAQIYSGSLKAIQAGTPRKEAVSGEVQRLISNGTLKREWAKDVTAAAVQCMKLFKQ